MRLSIMSRFMEIEGSVIRRGRIIPSEKDEFNDCFIIHSK